MTATVEQVLNTINEANLVDDVKALELDKPLNEQGIDSLDFSNVLFNMEETFNIEIPDEDIDGLQTINQIVSYINSKA